MECVQVLLEDGWLIQIDRFGCCSYFTYSRTSRSVSQQLVSSCLKTCTFDYLINTETKLPVPTVQSFS